MKNRLIAWVSLNSSTLGFVVLIAAVLIIISGCGTVAGIGKDIQTSAEWTKEKMGGDKK
jgi:predicted small secreted protein